jgi:peptide/nickel transport system permease protein
MRTYAVRRLLLVIPTLFLVTLVVFFSVRFIPGDIVDVILHEARHQSGVTPGLSTAEALRHTLGLDIPVHIQYFKWIGGVLRGDLGDSMWSGNPITSEILSRLPVSFELGLLSLLFTPLIAIPIGIYSAIRQDTWGDYLGRTISILAISLPSFWIGTMVIVYPSIWWNWVPQMEYIPFFKNPGANIVQFILPAFIMGMVMVGTIMRMTRTMMLEVLRQDYIRTAWAKGLKERSIIIRHAMKNSLIPIITILGSLLPVLIGGSVVLEQIFALPGVGRLLLQSVSQRDYPLLSGINLILAGAVLIANLLVDFAYAYLDPRIQYK